MNQIHLKKMPDRFFNKFDLFFYKFFVDPLARFCINFGFSPNYVTITSVNIQIVALFFLFKKNYKMFSILWWFYYLLDCVDGYLARLTDTCSDFGDAFDHVRDCVGFLLVWILLFRNRANVFLTLYSIYGLLYLNSMILQERSVVASVYGSEGNSFLKILNKFKGFGDLNSFVVKTFSPTTNLTILCVFIFYF